MKKYDELKKTNNPDKYYEYFWYSFKISMKNFFNNFNKKDLCQMIEDWSSTLNNLQKEKKYDDIQKNIKSYIKKYCEILIKHNTLYHGELLFTNIKRWNKYSEKYKIGYNDIIYLRLRIYLYGVNKKNNEILEVVNDDIYDILDYAIKNKYCSIINHITKAKDISDYILDKYSMKISKNINGIKLLKLFH